MLPLRHGKLALQKQGIKCDSSAALQDDEIHLFVPALVDSHLQRKNFWTQYSQMGINALCDISYHLTLRQPFHCQFLQVFSILFPATEARCVESLMVVGTPIVGASSRLRTDPSATQKLQTCHHYAMEAHLM
ncbi:hypothetical protein HRG_013213 [Hirsutella rhossiliensis]